MRKTSREETGAGKKQMRLLRYHDRDFSRRLLQNVLKKGRQVKERLGRLPLFMEVCGTHTMAFSRTGLRNNLKDIIEVRSGPGCPVCVTDQADLDRIIAFSREKNVVLGTFGDMVRVPGTYSSLEQEKASGSAVEIFYSPSDAVEFARRHPDREMVFIGVGFEATAPAVALSIAEAEEKGVKNFSLFSFHKLVPPALKALLDSREFLIDGFILPGHVSAVTGKKAFDFLAREYGIPAVVAGFEPLDLVGAAENLLDQLQKRVCRVDNNYTRVVKDEGNPAAQKVINDYYDLEEASWRGLGTIPSSGLALKEKVKTFDASLRFPMEASYSCSPSLNCSCGDVLAGKISPVQCPQFGSGCTPAEPLGPCMVSSEGACAACYYVSDV